MAGFSTFTEDPKQKHVEYKTQHRHDLSWYEWWNHDWVPEDSIKAAVSKGRCREFDLVISVIYLK